MGGDDSRSALGSTASAERRAAGALEAEILAILREADDPLTPGGVRERFTQRQGARRPSASVAPGGGTPGDGTPAEGPRAELSYSTVVTIVSRLHAKGLLARQRAGRGFTYTPLDDASLAASRMTQVLGSERDHDAVLSRFVSELSSRDARLLRELLASDTDSDDTDSDDSDPDDSDLGPAGERG